MKKLLLFSILLSLTVLEAAPFAAHASAESCEDQVVNAAVQDAQGIASDEDVQDDCAVEGGLKATSGNSYGLRVTCGDELGFTYDVTVIRAKDGCEIDDVSQIALE
jgi:hypothetical protein